MVGDEEKALQSCRPSVKSIGSFNNYPKWKDKLRENCFKRVREDRTRLLWKSRLPEAKFSNHEDFIKSTLRDIVSDELRKIKDASPNESPSPLLGTSTDDMIWEYEGLHTAYQGDCEEMLLEMQRIFYEDLRTKESRKGPENIIVTWEDEEDEYLSRLVYDHMLLNSDQVMEEVWCPICKEGKLQENGHHIYCSQCKLKLKKSLEVDLNHLRLRLGEAHTEHLDKGCMLRPEFCVETKFGLTALYIKCQGCNTFEIVL
ncbi:hypothetical protein PHJA_002562500 [Phtheirospermum japonicum]|uniref:RPA-interacting protein n=1 Tax=Phtheirospermum japonicum TaxID=374723 RepID=A0A830DAR9_9LAMI|nr:hypothetical protein PHJA_002562500 [Phtheirospermum japonicum]